MRNILCAVVLMGALVGCTAEERRDILRDVDTYNRNGVPTATEPAIGPVGIDTAEKIVSKAYSPGELVVYIGGLIVTVAAGYVGRKYFKKKAA